MFGRLVLLLLVAAPPRDLPQNGRVTPQLEATLAGLPTRPGVYLMRDARGTVLYVGKAQNLRSRGYGATGSARQPAAAASPVPPAPATSIGSAR